MEMENYLAPTLLAVSDVGSTLVNLPNALAHSLEEIGKIRLLAGISDLHIISSPDPAFPPPYGYGKINVDLNRGSGGKYIYLCYRYAAGYPITDLYIAFGGSPDVYIPDGFTKLPVDLNEGAGGDYIYLCYRKRYGDKPIINIQIIFGGNPDIQPSTQYTKIPVDLNRGAGGAYIYLCYQKG